MKFHWILDKKADAKLKKSCVELEYELRPRITKFLMSRLDNECDGDFSCFHFDVDMISKRITLSNKTPQEYIFKIQSDFDREINQNCC